MPEPPDDREGLARSAATSALSDVQTYLADALRERTPTVDDPARVRAAAVHVAGNDRVPPAEQVDIYRRQFWLRHYDALREDYPGLAFVVGDDPFDDFVQGYLTAHPPEDPSLRDLGKHIVRFAERWAFDERVRGIARDMVRYEHAFVDLFDGADVPPLDPERIRSLSPEQWEAASFALHPLLVPMRLGWPVHRLRYAVRDGMTPELPPPEPVRIVMFRDDLTIRFEELDATAYDLVLALRDGLPLGAALAFVAEPLDQAAADALAASVAEWFSRWAAWGWFVDVKIRPAREEGIFPPIAAPPCDHDHDDHDDHDRDHE